MSQRTKGKCKYCGKEYSFGYMGRHLKSCEVRQLKIQEEKGKRQCDYYLLSVTDEYRKEYWMFLEMPGTATLKDLDGFLRDIWVECCGHLSAFYINGETYDVAPNKDVFWGKPARNMGYQLKMVLKPDMIFTYEYDFGSTTSLVLKVLDCRPGLRGKENVTLLSRNNPPEHICGICGKRPATTLDISRLWEGEDGFLCDECIEELGEDYDDEFFMKVCNSPRMGVCGYDGSSIYPDQFRSDVE